MKVGDLVREQRCKDSIRETGIIIKVEHPKTCESDYRTPTTVLVFYGTLQPDQGILKREIWFHKRELELMNESR